MKVSISEYLSRDEDEFLLFQIKIKLHSGSNIKFDRSHLVENLGVNCQALAAALVARLPIAGTGGTSMGKALSLGAVVISAGGSVATADLSRAMAFVAAFSAHWGLPPPTAADLRRINAAALIAALAATLPAFLSFAVMHGIRAVACGGSGERSCGGVGNCEDGWDAAKVLAVCVCAATTTQTSGLGETGMIAGDGGLRARR